MNKRKIIISGISLILILTIFIFINPIVGKFLTGTARIIGKNINCEVYIEGTKKIEAKLYKSDSNFAENEKRNYLILYLRNVKNYKGIPVIVIDKENRIVMFPNASKKDYNLVFGNLLQSDSGANVMIPINDELKGFGVEPNLIITEKKIEFEINVENKIQKIKINIA
jgi:hypothetical protein